MTEMEPNADNKSEQAENVLPRKKVALPPYKGMAAYADRSGRSAGHPSWIKISIMAVAVLGVVAVMADLMTFARVKTAAGPAQSPTEMIVSISKATNRYVDPDRRYSVAVPDGWTWERKKNEEDYDVTFRGPERIEVSMLAVYAPGKTIEELKKEFEETEQDQRIISHIETTTFKGHPAIHRYCRLKLLSFHTLDVIAHGTAYHLMASVPTDQFASLKTVLSAFEESFEPIPPRS